MFDRISGKMYVCLKITLFPFCSPAFMREHIPCNQKHPRRGHDQLSQVDPSKAVIHTSMAISILIIYYSTSHLSVCLSISHLSNFEFVCIIPILCLSYLFLHFKILPQTLRNLSYLLKPLTCLFSITDLHILYFLLLAVSLSLFCIPTAPSLDADILCTQKGRGRNKQKINKMEKRMGMEWKMRRGKM